MLDNDDLEHLRNLSLPSEQNSSSAETASATQRPGEDEPAYIFEGVVNNWAFSDYNRTTPDYELQADLEEEKDETSFTSIDKVYFAQLVYEISDDLKTFSHPLLWSKLAIEALQCVSEDYLAELFKHSNMAAFHRDSDVVEPKDMKLADKLTGFDATSGALDLTSRPDHVHFSHIGCNCGCRDGDNGIIDLEIDVNE